MRATLLAVLFALAAQTAAAADPAPQRSLEDLTALVLKDGEATSIDALTAEALGLKNEPAPSKAMWVESKTAADGRDHIFEVLYKKGKTPEALVATELVLTMQKRGVTGEGKFVDDGAAYRLSLKGRLRGAVRVYGKIGRLNRERRKVKNVRAEFDKEMGFWLTDSVGLELKNK